MAPGGPDRTGAAARPAARPASWDDRPAWWFLWIAAAAALLSVAVSQIALGLALAWCAAGWMSRRRRPPRTGLERPVLALAGWALLTLPFSTDVASSLLHARRFYLFTALWLAAGLARTPARRRRLAAAVLGGAAVNAAVSIVTQAWLPHRWGARLPLLQHSTITGGWLMMVAALVAAAWGLARAARARWLLPPLALAVAAVALTQTRSAWIGLAVGALSLLALVGRRRRPAAAAGLAALLAAAVLLSPGEWRRRAASIADPAYRTNRQRLELWRVGWELVRRRPLLGVGDRDLAAFTPAMYTGAGKQRREHHSRHLHSNLVMLAAIWGVPGLLLGCWLMLAALRAAWRAVRAARQRGPPERLAWAAAAWAVWWAMLAAGLFDWTFGDQELSLLLWLVTGAALAPPGAPADDADPVSQA